MPLFVLDGILEGTNGLALRDLDRKKAAGIVAEYQTVEVEL